MVPAGIGNATTANGWYYQVLMGHGDGTFSGAPVTVGGVPNAVGDSPTLSFYAAADFDNDGHLDLLKPSPGSNVGAAPMSLTISPGMGNGAFGAPIVSATNFVPTIVAAADLNGDGAMDAIAVGYTAAGTLTLGVLFGQGNGRLAGELDYTLPTSGTRIAVGDFNGDGVPDINGDGITDLVVANSGAFPGSGFSPGVLHVYLGKSDGTFTASTPTVPPLNFADLALADVAPAIDTSRSALVPREKTAILTARIH